MVFLVVLFSSLKSWQHFHQPEVGPAWKREDLQTSLPFMTWGPTCLVRPNRATWTGVFFFGVFRCETLQHLVSTNGSHSHPFGELAGISPWNITAPQRLPIIPIIASEPRKHIERWSQLTWRKFSGVGFHHATLCDFVFPKVGSWISTMVDHSQPLLK